MLRSSRALRRTFSHQRRENRSPSAPARREGPPPSWRAQLLPRSNTCRHTPSCRTESSQLLRAACRCAPFRAIRSWPRQEKGIILRRMSVHIVPHPLVQDALLRLRDVKTETEEFRRLSVRISVLLVAEALHDLPTEPATAQTPLELAQGSRLARDVVVVPVLRAGLGMLEAVLTLLPGARVGHIGLQRDESTAQASKYYAKMP